MPVLEVVERPLEEVRHVGVAIQRTPSGYHSGFLYRLAEETPRLLHLAFHHMLRDDPASAVYRWAQLGMDEDNLVVFSELLARVAYKQPLVPYGFNSEGIAIDPTTGTMLSSTVGHGLTCATFMVATLKVYGYDLLDASTWPVREDDEAWQAEILVALARHASPEHVQAVRENPRSARLRPDEVVGSSTLSDDNWPVSYLAAREIADQVVADLA